MKKLIVTLNGSQEVELTSEEENIINQKRATWEAGAFDRAVNDLRHRRKPLLEETDWMANSDVTMSDAMRTYRQELRDITNGLTTVDEVNAVVFPEKPSE
ncbi:hypothetical protein HTVC203P_gp38 [Pelagibacter phage HTVC203P]|jgi:hypothetical protein|nr:hypothetical protein HTVC203P_gp38 [Pelagibacter phage HTVC203P]